jgi:hypothetical protein
LEILLLWLDDLDDLVFALALKWESLRRMVLQVGFVAALAVATCELSFTATEWTPTLAGVAAASVAMWTLGAVLRILYYRELRLVSATA